MRQPVTGQIAHPAGCVVVVYDPLESQLGAAAYRYLTLPRSVSTLTWSECGATLQWASVGTNQRSQCGPSLAYLPPLQTPMPLAGMRPIVAVADEPNSCATFVTINLESPP